MTTITPDSGNHSTTPASFRPAEGAPGTLTAVPHADQYRTTQQDAPERQPGAPRPTRPHPVSLGELAARLGVSDPAADEVTVTGDRKSVV